MSVEVRLSDTQAGVLGFEIADAVFHPFNGRSDMGASNFFGICWGQFMSQASIVNRIAC